MALLPLLLLSHLAKHPSEIRFLKSENRSANEGLTEGRSTSLCLAESPEAPEQAETGSEENKEGG